MHSLLHDIPRLLILFLEDLFLIFNQMLSIQAFGRRVSNFLTKTYVVGTQKNRLNETVLLSTPNIMLKLMGKKILTILRTKILFI